MKKLFTLIIAAFASLSFVTAPVFAECPDGTIPVSILDGDGEIISGSNGEKCLKTDDDGSNIIAILNLVVDILSIGIGILGVIGITLVGVQYLTAGGDEAKTRKSKQRMFEIVIGLVTYVVLYAALKWLLPGFTGTGS